MQFPINRPGAFEVDTVQSCFLYNLYSKTFYLTFKECFSLFQLFSGIIE